MPTADDCAWLLRFKVSRGDPAKHRAEAVVEPSGDLPAGEARLIGKGVIRVAADDSLAPLFSLVEEHGFKTVVMPPFGDARLAVAACKAFLERVPGVEWIRVVCLDEDDYDAYLVALQDYVPD